MCVCVCVRQCDSLQALVHMHVCVYIAYTVCVSIQEQMEMRGRAREWVQKKKQGDEKRGETVHIRGEGVNKTRRKVSVERLRIKNRFCFWCERGIRGYK